MEHCSTEDLKTPRNRSAKAISRACLFVLLAWMLIVTGFIFGKELSSGGITLLVFIGCVFTLFALWFSLEALVLNRESIETKLRSLRRKSLRKQVVLRRERRDIATKQFLGALKSADDSEPEQDSVHLVQENAKQLEEMSNSIKKLKRFALLCALGVVLFD